MKEGWKLFWRELTPKATGRWLGFVLAWLVFDTCLTFFNAFMTVLTGWPRR